MEGCRLNAILGCWNVRYLLRGALGVDEMKAAGWELQDIERRYLDCCQSSATRRYDVKGSTRVRDCNLPFSADECGTHAACATAGDSSYMRPGAAGPLYIAWQLYWPSQWQECSGRHRRVVGACVQPSVVCSGAVGDGLTS